MTRIDLESEFRGARVIVTGGLGFIGSHLARRLADLGGEVVVVDNLEPSYGGNLFNLHGYEERIRIHVSDVREPDTIRRLVEGQDFVFNLAGQTGHLDSMENPLRDLEINCAAQLSILEACRRHNPGARIVYASTRQIYGRPDRLPVAEDHPLRPVDVNGINKLAGESYHLLYHQVYGLRSCALRLTNTIGPHMRVKDARQTFVGVWIRHLIAGTPFEVWDGRQLRDFTFVGDAVEAFLVAGADPRAEGKIFNLGGDCVISLRDLAELLVELNGGGEFTVRAFPPPSQAIDIGDFYADDSLIRETLGWQPSVCLRDSLSSTLEFYREHLVRYL
jgi:UDP-glucose 4-epimerase